MDHDDWFITKERVKMLINNWGKVSIGRLASYTNKKTQRFNTAYICPGSWGCKRIFSRLVKWKQFFRTPVYLIPKLILHFMSSQYSAKGILACPYWPSSTFWPLLFKVDGEFQSFIKDVFVIQDVPKYTKLGNYKESLIGSDKFQGPLIVFELIKLIFLCFLDIILNEMW